MPFIQSFALPLIIVGARDKIGNMGALNNARERFSSVTMFDSNYCPHEVGVVTGHDVLHSHVFN